MAQDGDSDSKIVLAIGSHPDDIEFQCAGTLALLRQIGWRVQIATMTAGDCGARGQDAETISRIRKEEARRSALLLDADFHCLECKDVFILYERPAIVRTINIIRKIRPALVFTMSPSCYMEDHEITSKLVQTGCFAAGMENIKTIEPAFFHVPHLYYVDAIEGKDKTGEMIKPGLIIDISSVMDIKEQMLACHESQRNWLKDHHGIDHYLHKMKDFSRQRGNEISVEYGEGFRQHRGHAFPQNDLLKAELGHKVHLFQ